MANQCCLAGINGDMASTFNAAFKAAGAPAPATNAGLDVRELRKIGPDLLVCDIDALDVDPLELLRRVRFVLPRCTIAVYTDCMNQAWAVECHLAGANCVLSKDSDLRSISKGLRSALRSGCYTDPRFGNRSICADSLDAPKRAVVPRATTRGAA
jgi:DNA-binding NarL/FixJ family response regulator